VFFELLESLIRAPASSPRPTPLSRTRRVAAATADGRGRRVQIDRTDQVVLTQGKCPLLVLLIDLRRGPLVEPEDLDAGLGEVGGSARGENGLLEPSGRRARSGPGVADAISVPSPDSSARPVGHR